MPAVTIPGYDQPVHFPDSMSKKEINAAAKRLYDARQFANRTGGTKYPNPYQSTQPTPPHPTFDKVANWTVSNAPSITGGVGGIIGTVLAGGPGAILGAGLGGAYGGAVRAHAEGKNAKEIAHEAVKNEFIQGGLEMLGQGTGAMIGKVATKLGISERLLQFALKRPEDLATGVNPAEAMNRYQLHSNTIKGLYELTDQRIGSLNKTADALIRQSAPYSSTVRPYAVAKGVLNRYIREAASVGNEQSRTAVESMLQQLAEEFNNASTASAQGAARREVQQTATAIYGGKIVGGTRAGSVAYKNAMEDSISKLPADRIMTTEEANALKRVWGESVSWTKQAPQDSLQAAFKTTQNARRDIYNALNETISDAMGGNTGKQWKSIDRDVFQLIHARDALNEANLRTLTAQKSLIPQLVDVLRQPGPASQTANLMRMFQQSGMGGAIPAAAARTAAVGTVPAIQATGHGVSSLANLISQSMSSNPSQ